jgi:hypothetical protein
MCRSRAVTGDRPASSAPGHHEISRMVRLWRPRTRKRKLPVPTGASQ